MLEVSFHCTRCNQTLRKLLNGDPTNNRLHCVLNFLRHLGSSQRCKAETRSRWHVIDSEAFKRVFYALIIMRLGCGLCRSVGLLLLARIGFLSHVSNQVTEILRRCSHSVHCLRDQPQPSGCALLNWKFRKLGFRSNCMHERSSHVGSADFQPEPRHVIQQTSHNHARGCRCVHIIKFGHCVVFQDDARSHL